LDIQDPEVPASISNPLVNMQGLTSTSYPSQTPEMDKRKFTMLPTMGFSRTASEKIDFCETQNSSI
jgi:hypothetical protein